MMSNLRFAVRTLAKSPGTTSLVVLTLAVVIAATTVIYSTIDLVWHLVPAVDRERLVFVTSTDASRTQADASGEAVVIRSRVSVPDLADWIARSSTFEDLGGFVFGSATMTGQGVPIRLATRRVTANLLTMWGITPTLGRSFRPDESRTAAAGVTVLSYQFWQRQFSSSPAVLGQSVLLNGVPHTVLGVLPPQASSGLFRDTDVFVPLDLDSLRTPRNDRNVFVTGRLKPGVARDQANADIASIARQLQDEHPDTNTRIGAVVLPLIELSGFNVRVLLAGLGLIAVLVIVVACANVANVLMAQSLGRQQEFAVRAALGASQFDRIRQLMTESFLVSALAAAVGLVLGAWSVAALRWFAGDAFGYAELRVNGRVLAAGVVTAFVAPFIFALLPAIRSTTSNAEELKDGSRPVGFRPAGRRLRNLMLATQVGAAVIVMVQIGLLVRTSWRLSHLEPGFDPAQMLTFRVALPEGQYASSESIVRVFEDILTRLRSVPGVDAVGLTDRLPIADDDTMVPLSVEGDSLRPEERPRVARAAIGGEFLRSMRIPLLRGRTFADAELSTGAAVALVNEAAARRFWPSRNPIGRRVALESTDRSTEWLLIVGVAGNVRNADADQTAVPLVYVPASREPSHEVAILVRSEGADPLSLVPSIRAEVTQVDQDQPIHDVATMERVLFDDLAGTSVLAALLMGVGLVALCLVAAGIYGVASYSVTQRTREIGVRMALGARPGAVMRMVLAQGSAPVLGGGLVGLVLALAIAFSVGVSATEVDARDPLNYVVVMNSIVLVAAVASYVPARRASRVDPMTALRAE
jgi:predicted permease